MKENKLIAEFMGLVEPYELPQFGTIRPNGDFKTSFSNTQLKYHTSWDWLMPVVIKIGGTANILGAMKNLRTYSLVRNIDDTYQAVVEFIKQLKQD